MAQVLIPQVHMPVLPPMEEDMVMPHMAVIGEGEHRRHRTLPDQAEAAVGLGYNPAYLPPVISMIT